MPESLLIDDQFPGGNIVVERIEGDQVYLHQDFRDTEGYWFYWCFRVRGAARRRITFHFTQRRPIAARGPAVSQDGGLTWRWLGPGSVDPDDVRFSYAFGHAEEDVRFSFAMPYQDADLQRFLRTYENHPHLRVDALCRTRKNREVERLHFGCLDREPHFRVLLTCRHHACEMMPNYALEGILDEVLSESDEGSWLREQVEFLAVPFMDKDGVEDGDQGKNRRPHDHALDYRETSIYPAPAALRKFLPAWSAEKLFVAWDLHCPGHQGEFHEVLMCPNRLRHAENWKRTRVFLETLERVQQGPLIFSVADSDRFTTWDGSGKPGATPGGFSGWVRELPGVRIASALEIPYANAAGGEVNQESARAFGRDMARAFHAYLLEAKEKVSLSF